MSANPWWITNRYMLNPIWINSKMSTNPLVLATMSGIKYPWQIFIKNDGASKTALGLLGGGNSSALFQLWMAAILNIRGVPLAPPEVFRLKDGNQMLPNAFAKRLGSRVWLKLSHRFHKTR